jgi:hypothetical protein
MGWLSLGRVTHSIGLQLAGHLLAAAGNGMDEGGRVGHSSVLLRRNADICALSKNEAFWDVLSVASAATAGRGHRIKWH